MSKAATYTDGAGRERCVVCGERVEPHCRCTAPTNYREWRSVVRFGENIPKKGDRLIVEAELVGGGTADVSIEFWGIKHQEWYYENGIVTGLLIEYSCWIADITRLPGKPILKLVK